MLFLKIQSKLTREELEQQRQLLVDLRHEIGELKSIHQAGVVGSKGGGTRGGYGTAMPASEFFKQGKYKKVIINYILELIAARIHDLKKRVGVYAASTFVSNDAAEILQYISHQ